MVRTIVLSTLLVLLVFESSFGQEELLFLSDSNYRMKKEYVRSAFKGTRVINLQSLEKVAPGALQFLIQHRFGALNGGAYQLYGLDQATIRFALEYGITDFLMAGIGRSSYQKTYDAFIKISLTRQSRGIQSIPISLLYFGSAALNTLKWDDPALNNYFSSRLSYAHQIIIGSKVSQSFSFEIAPTLVHRNLVPTAGDQNDVFAVGAGFSYKLSKRVSLNLEYIYRIPPKDQSKSSYADFYNSFSIGLDIETGGHVFQFHLTNSLPMIEKGFIAESTENWSDGGIHLGFNISRNFTLIKKRQSK